MLGCLLLASHGRTTEPGVIWKLNETSQFGGHAAEVVGAPRIDADATRFDGKADGLFVPALPIAGAKNFTIEVLPQPAEGGEAAQRFLHLQDVNGARALLELRTNGQGGWWLDTFLLTGIPAAEHRMVLIDPQQVHPVGKWYWVALRHDGVRMAHFVNGQKECEALVDFVPFVEGQTSLGVRQNKVSWFKGAIREVRFAPSALPESQLQRLPP